MKVVLSLAAVLALAVGLNLTAADDANARCGIGWRCRGGAPAPCGGCRGAAYAPAPCGGGCGGYGAGYYYVPGAYYAYWAQPGFSSCYPGPGNCYWRRDCWYDSFGRRFCN